MSLHVQECNGKRPIEGELTNAYMKGYDRLRIFRRLIDSEKVEALEHRVQMLSEKDKEVEILRQELKATMQMVFQLQRAVKELPKKQK